MKQLRTIISDVSVFLSLCLVISISGWVGSLIGIFILPVTIYFINLNMQQEEIKGNEFCIRNSHWKLNEKLLTLLHFHLNKVPDHLLNKSFNNFTTVDIASNLLKTEENIICLIKKNYLTDEHMKIINYAYRNLNKLDRINHLYKKHKALSKLKDL